MAMPPSGFLCLGGGFLLLDLLRRKFKRRRRPSASSSDQDVEEHENIDATQQSEDGVSERSISHGGLDNEEPYKMLYNLEPAIISTSDPDGQSSGTYFFMKAGLPGSEADCPLREVEEHENIDATQQPEDGVSERSISHGGLDNEEPYKMLYNLEPAIISTSDPDGQSSGIDFFMKAGLPGSEADCPLIQWLQQREDDGIKPLATFKIRGMPRQTYIRDEIKVLTKSLVQFVQDLHIQGQCASGGTFRAKNISVVGGNLRFHNLELSSLTEKLRQENYNSIECMIMSVILREQEKQLPQDMQHFLKLLKNPRPHIYLISNHVALMNLRSCINLYQLLWDKKKAMNPTTCSKWKNAIKDLDIYCWSKYISKESPLFNVYKHRKYQGGNKVHLINFCRNAAAHLSEHSNRGELFQFEHISLIITASFPTLLADLQEKLHHHGILQEFV